MSRLSAVATVLVLANWDHHYDLDKEVRMLTIPKQHLLLLLVIIALVFSVTVGITSSTVGTDCCLWLSTFSSTMLLFVTSIKTRFMLRQSRGYNLMLQVL